MSRRLPPSTPTVLGIAAAVALVPLNSTMIAVALPKIAEDFDISTGTAGTLITVYLFAMLIGQPLGGRLGDTFGNRRTVNVALVGLIALSALAAAATTFTLLVVARVAQAAFAAALGPNVQSLLRAITPPEHQGRTFGLMGSMLGVGAASGPVIGGVLTQVFGWQAIFLFNIPVAGAALAVAMRIPPQPAAPPAKTDTRVPQTSGKIANPIFVAAFSVQALSTLAQYALLLVTPIILHARGWNSGATGAVLSALTVGMILMSPTGGRLGDRYGRRSPARAGLLVATAAIVVLLIGGASIATTALVAGLAGFGFGLGIAVPSLMTAALESVPMHRTGAAAGVLSTSRYLGSIATSIAVSVFVASDASGSRIVLAIATAAMVLAVIGTTALPERPHGDEHRRDDPHESSPRTT
jgi:MFS family permease